jgi:glycosyltransferase involved in cell wall biosynthesis
VGLLRFPDARRAWLRPAQQALREWLLNNRPDVVISSHEPAVSIMLGEECARRGLPWVVDLGDPVVTDYVPAHWRRQAMALEARVCRHADAVVTTNDATRDLLSTRHRAAADKIAVISQGFDPAAAEPDTQRTELSSTRRELSLLYTGRFYRFRSGEELFEAVLCTPGVVLDVVTPNLPRWLRGYAESHPNAIRVRRNLQHGDVLAAQRRADILVNLGNADPVQTPGKLYEYLGSSRPLLQVYQKASDPSNAFIMQLRRGWIVPAEVEALREQLARLLDMKRAGNLTEGMDLSMNSVRQHAWAIKAAALDKICRDVRHHRQHFPAEH